jgi:dolichol-phosphate mannosyltransferase
MDISVVVPVCNEEENVLPLAREVAAALAGREYELLFVDDGSTDGTAAAVLQARAAGIPGVRLLRHSFRSGQSAAVCSGVAAARAEWVATLDGDGQNDPADIPSLLAVWRAGVAGDRPLGLVAGQRRKRQDNFMKRMASRVGNGVRQWLLQDNTRDTGCGLKLFSREAFLRLPYFDHLHRFMPALMLREGYRIAHVDVNHRPRSAGVSKYGTLDRLMVSIADLRGVRWLRRRSRQPERIDEV